MKTVKTHPLWKNPDAVDVPATISNAYREAVNVEAKRFNGNRELAAQDIYARTLAYARKVKAAPRSLLGRLFERGNSGFSRATPAQAKAHWRRRLRRGTPSAVGGWASSPSK